MRVFLDFEASSLGKTSYPIEVAWVFEDGRSRSFLIRPLPEWNDWSAEAEALHGISRAELNDSGLPPGDVARQMIDNLSGHALFASAPSWDGKWLSTLLRGGGYPRHALRLTRSDEASFQEAQQRLGPDCSEVEVNALVQDIISKTAPHAPAHRALADAGLELTRLKCIIEIATARSMDVCYSQSI